MELEIIYRDKFLIAINKPHGLLVHKSPIANDADTFAIQELRDQINMKVFPVHRLDRKTSGCLLFALVKEADSAMQQLFSNRSVTKTYLAIVRGFTNSSGTIDYPLKKENGTIQEAFTEYRTIAQSEINVPFGAHPTSRYSLVEVMPQTGRMHQIRKHLAHIHHPIIGDRPHGCNKQNKLFKEKWGMISMMLHASKLEFKHPFLDTYIEIQSDPSPEFIRMGNMLKWDVKELNKVDSNKL